VVDLVVQGGLLEGEEAMALLTPVPLNPALLSGG
jgi:aspartate ammonia-lyase